MPPEEKTYRVARRQRSGKLYFLYGMRRGVPLPLYLLIIHGKGIGVQREAVRKLLARDPRVTSYGDAPAEHGGRGATVVTLR